MRAPLLASLTLLAAAAGAAPVEGLVPLSPDTPVELAAERLSREPDGEVRAVGKVRVRAGTLLVGADELTLEPELGRVTARGAVTLVEGRHVVRAVRIRLDLATGEGVLEGAALFEKREPIAPEVALAAADVDALAALSVNALDVRAASIARRRDGTFVALSPAVTTCDCDEAPPSFRLAASEATVIPGRSVRLDWPKIEVGGVPVAVLPFLSLPLERRKTGLLAPVVGYSGRRGASWEQPFFLVLGESYDATLTAGWFLGREDALVFAGPKAGLELRWAPREGSVGRAFFAYGYDTSAVEARQAGLRRAHVHRHAFVLTQRDDWGGGLADQLAISLVSDRRYVSDFTDDVTLRGEQSVRSSAWVAHRGERTLLAFEGTFLQDLRREPPLLLPVPLPAVDDLGLLPDRRRTFQRLPALALDVVQLRLLDEARLSLHLGVARFSPIDAPRFGDEGRDGLAPGDLGYAGPDEGELDGILDAGERRAVTRLSVRPSLSIPLAWGPYLAVTPYAGYREQLYARDVGPSARQGWGVVGATARTELTRGFGEGAGALRHAVGPRLELRRLLPGGGESLGERPYDELDLGPARAVTQARAALFNRLDGRLGARTLRLELLVGEDATLAPEEGSREDFLSLDSVVGPLGLGGLLRRDGRAGGLVEVSADGSVAIPGGHEVRAGYRSLAAGGSARIRAAPDELLSDAPPVAFLPGLEQLTAGLTLQLSDDLRARYDVLHLFTLGAVVQQTAGISFGSRCNCWRAEVSAALRRGQDVPDVFFTADLTGLAEL